MGANHFPERFAAFGRFDARAMAGTVTIVGAGPGDPGLLTLHAARAIAAADVILHDALVGEDILALTGPQTHLIPVGKRGGKPSMSQRRIKDMLADWARSGHAVVRLKGGDPIVFGRCGEELARLHAEGIPVRIIPGVTAALGAAAEAGIPLTHRDFANGLRFVTARRRNGDCEPVDWARFADPDTTLVLYMGRAESGHVAEGLMRGGLDRETPVAIVGNATLPDALYRKSSLDRLPQSVAMMPPDIPLLVIVGAAVAFSQPWRGLSLNDTMEVMAGSAAGTSLPMACSWIS